MKSVTTSTPDVHSGTWSKPIRTTGGHVLLRARNVTANGRIVLCGRLKPDWDSAATR